MRTSGVRALVLACLVAATVAAFNGLPNLVEGLGADVGLVLAPREPPPRSGWSMVINHQPSLCCEARDEYRS